MPVTRAELIDGLQAMAHRYDMTATERYEADSEAFYAQTGYMAPGKDVPMAMGGQDEAERRAAWDAWVAERNSDQKRMFLEAAAALAAPPGLVWQPIDTAPKDGTRVLLGCMQDVEHDAVSTCGSWSDAEEDGPDVMGHDAGFWDVDYGVFQPGRSFGQVGHRYKGRQPTHWMPLPASPETPTEPA